MGTISRMVASETKDARKIGLKNRNTTQSFVGHVDRLRRDLGLSIYQIHMTCRENGHSVTYDSVRRFFGVGNSKPGAVVLSAAIAIVQAVEKSIDLDVVRYK